MTCQDLKAAMVQWLGDEIGCETIASEVSAAPQQGREIDRFILKLPLLKPNGDAIDLGIERSNGLCRISDLGETRETLFLGGVDLSGNRRAEFKEITRSFGIFEDGRELLVEAALPNLAATVFEFAHAVQSILSLQLTVTHEVPKRDFQALVTRFLVEQRVAFEVPAQGVQGKTGPQPFSFVLNHSQTRTLVKTLSAGDRRAAESSAKQAIFEVGDVRLLRGPIDAAVIADDEGPRRDRVWDEEMLRMFTGYEIPVYRFRKDRSALTTLAESHRI